MDRPKIVVVAIVLLLIGLLAGYLFWGQQSKTLADELAQARTKLAEAQKSAGQEAAMKAKLDAAEAQLKELMERLNKEKEARQKLEARVAKGKK